MRRHVPALTVAAAIAAGASLSSQQAPPVFRSKANLVQLHVVVRDADGRPVHGLTSADFSVVDVKKPRDVAMFEEVSRPPAPPALVPVTFPLDVADNRVAKVSRLVVIILDDMVIAPMLEKAKALARAAVSRLSADALIAFLTTSGMNGVESTADHAAILRAINRAGPPTGAPKIPQRFGSMTSSPTLAEKLLLDGDNSGCHLTMLGQAAQMIRGPEATRRLFVYVGPYCGLDPFDEANMRPDSPYFQRVRYMMEALRQSNVTMYALDPRGEMGFSLAHFATEDITGTDDRPSRYAPTRSSSPVISSQGALKELTETTGGCAVTNSNEFEAGFAQIEDDLSHYYVLGFYTDDPKPNRYHAVDVKLSRPDLTVRFRPGYFSGTLPTREDRDPMVRLSASAIPSSDLPLRLFAVSEPHGGDRRVNLVLEVGWTGLEKPDASGRWQEFLDALVLVAKPSSGKIERKWAMKRPVAVALSSAGPRGFAAYQAVTQVDLSPGSYQVRLSAKSATGKMGSVYLGLEIPKTEAVSLGEVLVGAPDRIAPTLAASPKGVEPPPMPMTLDRVFDRTERVRFFAKVFQPASSAPPKATLSFIDTEGKVVHSIEAPTAAGARAIDMTVSLNSLAPGAYRARLSVGGVTPVAIREVSLVIKMSSEAISLQIASELI